MQKELKIKISVDKKTGAIKVVDGEFNKLSNSSKKASKSVDSFYKSLGNIAKAVAGIYVLKQAFDFTKEVSATGMRIESMTMSLEAAVGSSKKASTELKFLTKTADKLGLSFEASLDGFSQFAAAAKQTSMEGKGVEKIFTGVSEASAVMGLSIDDQNGVFRALSQMMSKGKIQAEELRGQLGERLPGAFQIAARSMGMTTSELDKFMSSGKLISEDFLPKFGKQLEKEFGEKAVLASKTARAEQNRYNNSLLNMKVAMSDAGINDFSKSFYKLGTDVIKESTHWLNQWNIQVNEMSDISSKSGLEKLTKQYKDAIEKSRLLNLQEKSYKEQIESRAGTWNLLKGFLKSEVGLNADIVKQKALIAKLERAINKEVFKTTKEVKKVLGYDEKKAITTKKILKNITAISKLSLDEAEFMKEYNSAQTKATDKFKIKLDLYKQGLASIITPLEKVNSKYLEMYNVAKDLFNEKQLKKFYKVWGSEAQNASTLIVTKKDKPKIKSTFQDWGKTLNSSISNSLVSALTSGDVMGAVKGLGGSISASMIQASVSNISKGGDTLKEAGGLGSMGGLGGIAAGVGISLVMSEVFKKRQSAEEIATQTLSKFNSEITDATKSLSSLGLSGSAFVKQMQMLTDKMNAEQNAGGYALSGKINNEIISKINSESLSVFDINKVTLSQALSKINNTYYMNGKQGGYYDNYNKQNSVAYSKFDIEAYTKLKEELQILMLKGNNNGLDANGIVRRKEILSSSLYGIGKDLEKFTSIVDEASKKSKANIQSFSDSFKTEKQLAEDLANVMGVDLATNTQELISLYTELAKSGNELTDQELKLLEANKGLFASYEQSISTLSSALLSLNNTVESLKISALGGEYGLQSFSDSMKKTKLLVNGDASVYNSSLQDTISKSSILNDVSNFANKQDQKFAQLVAINQFKDLEVKTVSQIDYLKEISKNTLDTVNAISSLDFGSTLASTYENVLGRKADLPGATYWDNQLSSGAVLQENLNKTIAASAVNYSAGATETVSLSAITSSKANGAEYLVQDIYSKYGLDKYQTDNSGYKYWESQLLSGAVSTSNLDATIKKAAEELLNKKLTSFADGGIVTSPTIGLIGEAGYNEAVIPFKNPSDPLNMNAVVVELKELKKVMQTQEKRIASMQIENIKQRKLLERQEAFNLGLIA